MNIDSFVERPSILSRLDSRLKLILLLELCALVFLPLKTAAIAGLAAALSLFAASQTGFKRASKVFGSVLPVILIMLVLSPLTERAGDPLLVLGGTVVLTRQALDSLLRIGSRFLILTFGFSLLIQTTRQGDLVEALVCFGLSYKASLTVSLILRFLPSLSHAFSQISESHLLRQSKAGRRRKIGETIPSLISALVFALRQIPLSAMALEQRGFGGSVKPSRFHKLPGFGSSVWVLAAFTAAAAAFCLLFWK
ncbi:MAG: energy-coupling factor transporter transmembrane component T [Sphaerochaetaceae bacterium]|jgi:energy-coupling factor transporter transmembrane protein EcfT